MKNILMTSVLVLISFLGLAQHKAIEVVKVGKGSPVVLLPGFGCPGAVWNETVAQLSKTHECHVVSYAGFNGIAPLDTLWLSSVEKGVEEYIESKRLKNVTVIGHSMGGTLGLMLCQNQKERVKKLVVVDMLPCIGVMMIPNFKPEYATYDNPYNKQLLAMDSTAFRGMQTQMVANMCTDKARQEQIISWMMKADRKTYVYGYTDLMRVDLREAVGSIEQPVLILAAGKYPSKEQILKVYDEQYAKLKGKTIKFVDGSAHFVMYDKPEVMMGEVNQFLAK